METQLYPGIAFSPPAALTDNIGAGDTIIPVSDAGSFPPAPNLATIGADEDGETILYAAKTATALSGCVRGVEGTARAWSAGEPIARNWTAKDHADLIAAVREAKEASDPAGTAAAAVEAHDGDAKAHGERFAAKQDALRGRPGEAVGFGANGAAMAVQGWSNPNLLDNWYFVDPVNQRGQTEYTAAGYTIDRWRMAIDIGKILVEDDGLVVDATSNAVTFYQPFDGKLRWILGKTFTVTIEYTYLSGPVWSELMFNLNGTLNALHTGNLAAETGKRMVRSVTAVIPGSVTGSEAPLSLAWFYAAKGAKVKIHSIKCELGARQTLLHQDADGHWVLNDPPPNKALELAKCQRYQVAFSVPYTVIGSGFAINSTTAHIHFVLANLAGNAAASIKNIYLVSVNHPGANGIIATGIDTLYGENGTFGSTVPCAGGLTPGEPLLLQLRTNSYFIADKNL